MNTIAHASLARIALPIAVFALAGTAGLAQAPATSAAGAAPAAAPAAPAVPPLLLAIDGFADGGHIPVRYSQAAPGVAPGEGTSPAMNWNNVPKDTKSFVLHMHDLDVARNRTTEDQAHWVVWNIPATATGMAEGMPRGARLADGSYQVSATGNLYRGPGAPANVPEHHYTFELYALDMMLDVTPLPDAFETRTAVLRAMQGHVLGKAVYGGLFHRPAP